MTEAEWLACADPHRMLEFLGENASLRKQRLFACAAVRRVWHLLLDDHSREAVEEAERYADGIGCEEDRVLLYRRAREVAREYAFSRTGQDGDYSAWKAKEEAARAAAWTAACAEYEYGSDPIAEAAFGAEYAAGNAAWAKYDAECDPGQALTTKAAIDACQAAAIAHQGEAITQAAILRDLFGNPFRAKRFDSSWQQAPIRVAALAIYKSRDLPSGTLDNTLLACLSDALEEVGCPDQLILGHLRDPALHYRGCWVVDLILGKE